MEAGSRAGGTHENAGGAEGERLEHVGAAADAAVEVHRDAPLRRRHDLLEGADGRWHVVQLARAVVRHDDARRAGVDGQPRCGRTDDAASSASFTRVMSGRRRRLVALKKLTVLCRDDSLHQDRQRGDALQPLDILHVHKRSTASRVVVAPCIGIISSYQSKIIIPSSSVCGQFARQRTTQAQNRWPANAKQAGFISHQYQWVRECEQKRSAGKNSEDVTNLVHLAEVQALKVLQRQVWRQNKPAVVQAFCCLAMSGGMVL